MNSKTLNRFVHITDSPNGLAASRIIRRNDYRAPTQTVADNDDDSIVLVPQKSFETFESALQWCEIRADTKKEILLHDYQKKKMHVTDESFIDTLNMIEIDNGSM